MRGAWDPRRFVAHRGFRARYPENSFSAFKAAFRAGALFCECDVQLSQDGIPMIYHDASLRRVSGRAGKVWDFPAKRLQRFSASEAGRLGSRFKQERITSLRRLAAFLAKEPKGRLFVELKEESIQAFGRLEFLAAVHQALAPIRKRAILISFDFEILAMARALSPYPLGLVLRRWSDWRTKEAKQLQAEYVFSGTEMLPKKGSLRIPASTHCVYEVPDPAEGKKLLLRGVDMIESFALDQYLKRRPK